MIVLIIVCGRLSVLFVGQHSTLLAHVSDLRVSVQSISENMHMVNVCICLSVCLFVCLSVCPLAWFDAHCRLHTQEGASSAVVGIQ